jgi:hypothetical protein
MTQLSLLLRTLKHGQLFVSAAPAELRSILLVFVCPSLLWRAEHIKSFSVIRRRGGANIDILEAVGHLDRSRGTTGVSIELPVLCI